MFSLRRLPLPSSTTMPVSTKRRPKGLWKARVTATTRHKPKPSDSIDDSDSDSSLSSLKRRRYSQSDSTDESDQEDIYYWDYSRQCSPRPARESCWDRRTRIMDSSSTAAAGSETKTTCDLEDWEDLKELFNKAAEQYESEDAAEALPLIRGVIHECHRFLIFHEDPSVLYSTPRPYSPDGEDKPRKKCKCIEIPTAFHAILGTALFLFGNLILQDPSLALEGEPDTPIPYWLAALDVFETGESLPSKTSGLGVDPPEDWRMAIVWGRTLVCIADETLSRHAKATKEGSITASTTPVAEFADQEPDWPPESPFATIASRRPPVTRRMSMSTASANDIMVLAMDQFSRGIFHMPHPQHSPADPPAPPLVDSFSRPKELFTIASEVLLIAEKMEEPGERQYWAQWADSVFNQMKMEADMDTWRGPITAARGRCWLIVGSAKVEALEDAMESDDGVLASEDAQEARDGLMKAIEFLERAKGSASSSFKPDSQELQPLLAEALLTLANLTQDETKREELYARAQLEGGDDLELDEMDCD
ncbi:hypothetical protein C8J56DRAFT_911830 [Mycena floridula]|nr:hypothetical protein C8J56DRAFT_911830 [Mycena floridula]